MTSSIITIYSLIKDWLAEHKTSSKPSLLIILGATASGKTALSLKIAKKFNGEIISADSRQLYKGLDIGTDKISFHDREGIPHHLIDISTPEKAITLYEYVQIAHQVIAKISRSHKLPILVGGTGLYLNAITENYQIPSKTSNHIIRFELEEDLLNHGEDYLYNKLKKLDPIAAQTIDKRNHRYLLRALEINLLTGQRKTYLKGPKLYDTLKIGLSCPRWILYQRINDRVEEQIQNGLIAETKELLQKYPTDLPAMTSLGYRQISRYLQGELTLEQAKELLKQQTRHYARRQLTWFRRDKEIKWINYNN